MKLKIEKDRALTAHKHADNTGKKLLEDLLGQEHFIPIPIMQRLDGTWKNACGIYEEMFGLDPSDLPFENPINDLQRATNSNYQQDVIQDVLSEGWISDYTDGKPKWFVVYAPNASGFGFSFSCTDCWRTDSDVGARRDFETAEKAKFFGTKYIDIIQPSLIKNKRK